MRRIYVTYCRGQRQEFLPHEFNLIKTLLKDNPGVKIEIWAEEVTNEYYKLNFA